MDRPGVAPLSEDAFTKEGNMQPPIIVYGQKGSGSVTVEATLLLLGQPHEVVEVAPTERPKDGDLTDAQMALINPMQQVPAIRLPDGRLMTESAAILIWLADRHPDSRLAPAPDDPRRVEFLRWMMFVSSQIYAMIWITEDVRRLAADESHETVVRSRVHDRMVECWRVMEAQVSPGRYILGDALSVLDVYVAVTSAWGPGRKRFYEIAPELTKVVRRVDADPRLAALWKERFS
jgi:GST-like protein